MSTIFYLLACAGWFIAFVWFLALLTTISDSLHELVQELKKLREAQERSR